MKTAVSVPNEVFAKADALAKATGRSRSEVYSAALAEYVARHADDEVTAALDSVVGQLAEASGPDEFVSTAAAGTLENLEW
jgi:predicted transcriptional regulator